MSVAESHRDGAVLIAAPGWHDETSRRREQAADGFRTLPRGARVRRDVSLSVEPSRPRGRGSGRRRGSAPVSGAGGAVHRASTTYASTGSLRSRYARATSAAGSRCVRCSVTHRCSTWRRPAPATHACGACYGVHSPFEAELREGATSAPSLRQRVAWRGAAWVERRLLAASDIVHYDSSYTCHLMKELYPAATHGKGVVLPGGWTTRAFIRPTCRAMRCDAASALRGGPASRRSSPCAACFPAWGSTR